MAKLMQAVSTYGPKLELEPTAQLDEVAAWMAMRTGINKSEVMAMIQEVSEAILHFNGRGIPVKLPGVGTFTPSVDRHGTLRINTRPDVVLKKGINRPDGFTGSMRNKNRIGLDNAGFKALWDVDHPTDPLDI